jgi:ribosomal protein S18 acetylase RimI-like enzyme
VAYDAHDVAGADEMDERMNGFEVRDASHEDAPAIAAIHVRSWRAAYRGILPDAQLESLSIAERRRAWEALLREDADRWLTLVAEHVPGRPCGFCSASTPSLDPRAGEDVAEIGALYIDPDYFRQGGGSAILTVALRDLAEQGWRETVLWVLPDNRGALTFYDRFGFEIEQGVEKLEERSGRPVIRLRATLARIE